MAYCLFLFNINLYFQFDFKLGNSGHKNTNSLFNAN